jgi:hypothetical protein
MRAHYSAYLNRFKKEQQMSNVEFSQSLPVRHEVDVFVAGGGPAGFAAAVAAARQGASVYLAEASTAFGGMGTLGMVPAFMQFSDEVNFLAGGIGREIYDRLWDADGAGHGGAKDVGRCGCGIKAEVLKKIYDEMAEEAGFDFTFHTQVIAANTDAENVTHVVCSGKGGLFAVKAKAYVDGTGDGDLAVQAGAKFNKGDENGIMMPGTLCSLWADVDFDTVYAYEKEKPRWESLQAAFDDGVFTHEDWHLPGHWRVGQNTSGGNIGHTFDVDGTDERSLTKALLWGRKSLREYEKFYKEYRKGFEKMELVSTGSLLGIRETRRIIGEYEFGLDDYMERAVFEDEIGRYAYPVDIHPSKADPEAYQKFLQEYTKDMKYNPGESYGIPYRTLVVKGLKNVWVAGRCISVDRYVQASVRVMPGCYITGQAAGLAAAMAAQQNVAAQDVPVDELQSKLKAMGGYLPNAK